MVRTGGGGEGGIHVYGNFVARSVGIKSISQDKILSESSIKMAHRYMFRSEEDRRR
jgi:hypothetical protein